MTDVCPTTYKKKKGYNSAFTINSRIKGEEVK